MRFCDYPPGSGIGFPKRTHCDVLFYFSQTLAFFSFECLPTSLCTSQEMNFECQPEAAEALSRFAQGVVLVAQWQQDSGYTVTLSKKSDVFNVLYDEATKNIDVFVANINLRLYLYSTMLMC